MTKKEKNSLEKNKCAASYNISFSRFPTANMSCIDACQDRFAEILQLAGIVLVSWAGRLRSFTLLTCAHYIFILPGSLKAKQFLITN